MAAWMGIPDFLREVDQLARDRSSSLDRTGDPVTLLHDEHPDCLHPDDTGAWASVYEELSEFTTELLQEARPSAYEAAHSPNVHVLEAEVTRYHIHWYFWTQRLVA